MKAIETNATVNEQGQLYLDDPIEMGVIHCFNSFNQVNCLETKSRE